MNDNIAQLEQTIERLENTYSDYYNVKARNEFLEKQLQELTRELRNRSKRQGRKLKFNADQQDAIRAERAAGVKISVLAKKYSCSQSTIHQIVKDIDVDLRRRSTSDEIKNSN